MQFIFHDGKHPDSRVTDNVFRIRHDVFDVRLKWKVVSSDGMERDEFDDMSPLYLYAIDPDTGAEGCFRLLPTTGPYMLRDVFPDLLDGNSAPRAADVWEISRFAVIPGRAGDQGLAAVNRLTRWMLVELLILCLDRGISRVVAVTDVGFERILKRAGLPTQRFGPVRMVGKVQTVAGWADVSQSSLLAVVGGLQASSDSYAPVHGKEAA